jgi:hypothetical protein
MALKLAYIGLSLLMNIILALFGFKAINFTSSIPRIRQKRKLILICGLVVWQLYVFFTAHYKILYSFDFPPRFAVLLIIPLFVFTAVFFYKNRRKKWISAIPDSWLFSYQSFRIAIESIFLASVSAGILHYHVTIFGYNYDMIYAYSIPILALLIFKFKLLPKSLILLWNYIGLAVIASIIFLFISTIYLPEMWGTKETVAPLEFTLYPYILVAGFLMPSAVFIHTWSIVKYYQENNYSSSSI